MEISEEENERIKALLMAKPVDGTQITKPSKLEIPSFRCGVCTGDCEGSCEAACRDLQEITKLTGQGLTRQGHAVIASWEGNAWEEEDAWEEDKRRKEEEKDGKLSWETGEDILALRRLKEKFEKAKKAEEKRKRRSAWEF